MVRLRVLNGTSADVRLCDSCRYGIIRKDSTGREIVHCDYIGGGEPFEVKTKVVECNVYKNRAQKTENELEKIAWILNVKGKTILGFVPPKKNREDD